MIRIQENVEKNKRQKKEKNVKYNKNEGKKKSNPFGRSVSVPFGFLDPIFVGFVRLVMGRVILGFRHPSATNTDHLTRKTLSVTL